MSETSAAIATSTLSLNSLEEYEPPIGAAATQRILEKARRLRTPHAVHISSTFYGGGVTEILTPLTLMINAMVIATGWRMIQGMPAFFGCTKNLRNTLQGLRERLGLRAREIVHERFLLSRLVEDWLDLLATLEGRPRYTALGGVST
jgi:trehalose synthase